MAHPSEKTLFANNPIPVDFDELRSHVQNVYESDALAVNIDVGGFGCASDPFRPLTVVKAAPHARKHYHAISIVEEWAIARFYVTHYEDGSVRPDDQHVNLFGASSDSCSVNLSALKYSGTPNLTELEAGYEYLGLDDRDYLYFAVYYSKLPFAAHADWEHLYRTARRNLHNPRTQLVFGCEKNRGEAYYHVNVLKSVYDGITSKSL